MVRAAGHPDGMEGGVNRIRSVFSDVDGYDILAVGLLLSIAVTLILGGLRGSRRKAQRCHRFYSAAATARDSLRIQVLRPECEETP